MLYRALQRLSGVCNRGDLTNLAHMEPERIALLVRRGAVAPISPPPLEELPGWEKRAAKLAKYDILTAEQFLEADNAQLCRVLRVKAETVEQYRRDVYESLVVREVPPAF